ncbi:MAG: WbqC family protein, partial [Bacteroidota bacterium]
FFLQKPDSSFYDKRSFIDPKKDYICSKVYSPTPYRQVFGNIFVPNLSILDLLSCVGPDCGTYL